MENGSHIRSNNRMFRRSGGIRRFVDHDEDDSMIKLKCDYSSLAEMFGRSRDPITDGEHRGRGEEGWTIFPGRRGRRNGEKARNETG